MNRHYDVIVLGRSLGALSAAALLARRDFRVLVLGQGQRPPSYRLDRHLLGRRVFSMLAATSPSWRRILQELAQSPRFRRRTELLDPMFSVLAPGRRIAIPPDMDQFAREIDREFPEVRQLVDELYQGFAQVNAAADAAFEKDAVWPPGTFWERLETGRVAAGLPFVNQDHPQDLLGKFPAGHAYRDIVTVPAMFASHLASTGQKLPAFALARLHGAWTRGVHCLARGEDEFAEFLIERIEALGGVCRLEQRASSIVVRRGSAVGIIEDGEEEPTGAGAILASLSGEAIADLTGGEGITKHALKDWPRLTATAGRFVVSMVVKTRGLPAPLSREAFVLPKVEGRPTPRRPIVHLQRWDFATRPDATPEAKDETLLVAETLLPTRGPLSLLEARHAVVSTLREALPFIDRHIVVIDSPHDGLPAHDYSQGTRREIDRIHLQGAGAFAEPMEWLWSVDPPGYLDLCAEPVRGPIPNTYLVGPTVLPALGQEGELLAAWAVARIVTKKDRSRQKMRRHSWTKIETG